MKNCNMKILVGIILLILSSIQIEAQSLPGNAVLKNFKPFATPRTNGRPGEIYRINENGVKFIVQDLVNIKEKSSEEGDIVGRMYFTADEMLTMLNLEFDRLEIIPVEIKIVNAIREYNEQITLDNALYGDGKIREIIKDPKSKYYIIREAILSKEVTFRFSLDVVKKIKKGANALTEIKSSSEIDFPYEIQKKFKTNKRFFYLEQEIKIEPYDI